MQRNGTNDVRSWGRAARALHWAMALLIAVEVPAGFVMSRTYAQPGTAATWHYWASNAHHSAGLSLLALALARVIVRLVAPHPAPIGSKAKQGVARSSHRLMYLLLLLIPLTGWAAVSSLQASAQFPNPLWVFGIDGFGPGGLVPHIVPPVPWDSASPWRYATFATGHRWLLIAGGALLALHVAAALWHHFHLRDQTLRRMLKDAA